MAICFVRNSSTISHNISIWYSKNVTDRSGVRSKVMETEVWYTSSFNSYGRLHSETWKAGEQKGSKQNNADSVIIDETKGQESGVVSDLPDTKYILNTNTKKFHYPTCFSAKDMKDKIKKRVLKREILL